MEDVVGAGAEAGGEAGARARIAAVTDRGRVVGPSVGEIYPRAAGATHEIGKALPPQGADTTSTIAGKAAVASRDLGGASPGLTPGLQQSQRPTLLRHLDGPVQVRPEWRRLRACLARRAVVVK